MAERKTGKRANELGPTGERLADNVRSFRTEQALSTQALSERMETLGRPIPPTGITRIEAKGRRVDADDLVALAIALRTTPVRLLLSDGDALDETALTPTITPTDAQAWNWALGDSPLLDALTDEELDSPYDTRMITDFRRRALPEHRRVVDNHSAVRAAEDVANRLRLVLERLPLDDDSPAGYRRSVERSKNNTPQALRSALRRLLFEVDDLIGADDGEH